MTALYLVRRREPETHRVVPVRRLELDDDQAAAIFLRGNPVWGLPLACFTPWAQDAARLGIDPDSVLRIES